jgi:hypothetical protein
MLKAKRESMEHKNIIFTISEDLKTRLRHRIAKKNQSTSNTISQPLVEEQDQDVAYKNTNKDVDRLDVLLDWNSSNDVNDLVIKDENWDWLKEI